MSSMLQFLEHDTPADVEHVAKDSVRVLHIINGEHYAGAERVQDLLGVRLNEFGYEAGFVCMKPGQFPALRQAIHQPLYEVPMRSRWDLQAGPGDFPPGTPRRLFIDPYTYGPFGTRRPAGRIPGRGADGASHP